MIGQKISIPRRKLRFGPSQSVPAGHKGVRDILHRAACIEQLQ
jgi:hypothetical protein